MKKLIIILAILLISIPVFASDNAVVKELTGRVEIQAPGGNWQRAAAGDILPTGASISTGFGSSAVLEVGASVLEVDALTRMKLEELMQSQGAQTTGLFLRVGKVNAEVKRDAGLSHDFKLRSPSSTAAVRGTSFSYDGTTLTVESGAVSFFSESIAREQRVSGGEESTVDDSGKTSNPSNEKAKKAATVASLAKQQNNNSQSGASQTSNAGGVSSAVSQSPVKMFGDIIISVE